METTQSTNNIEGLEDFGSSESVSNIADFLSLDELGIDTSSSSSTVEGLDLDEVEKKEPKQKEDKIVEIDDVLKGKKEVKVDDLLEKLDTEAEKNTSSVDIDLDEEDTPSTIGATDYKSIAKDLIDNGIWEEIGAFETEDGEVPFDEMNIDKDTFIALMKHNQDELKSKLTSNTVSTEGISDFTQKLISIEKHGGNVAQAIEAYETVKAPLDSINIEDVRGQRAVCYLRLQQQGIDGEEAKDLIETYELKGVLEDKAIQFKEQLDNAFNSWIEQQNEAAIESDRKYKESLKNYRGGLNEAFKSNKDFALSETHRRKLVDIATKENPDGSFELDTLLDNFRRNPLEAAELLLFVTDKENYLKTKSKKLLDEERKATMKTINIIPKGKSKIDLPDVNKKPSSVGSILSLDKLK